MTKAVVRAGDALGFTSAELAAISGVLPAIMSRLRKGDYVLGMKDKSYELAALLVRFFRSLDAIVGGDSAVRLAWLRRDNAALGGAPVLCRTGHQFAGGGEGRGQRFESSRVRHFRTKLRTGPEAAATFARFSLETASASAALGPDMTICVLPTTIWETKARM